MHVLDWFATGILDIVVRAFHIDDIYDDWWDEDDEYFLE